MTDYEYVVMKQIGDNEPTIVDEYNGTYNDFWDADNAMIEAKDSLGRGGYHITSLEQVAKVVESLERDAQTRFYVAGRPVAEWTETDRPR